MKKRCPRCSGKGYFDVKIKNLGTLKMVDATVPCNNCDNGIVDTEEWYESFKKFGIPVETDVKIS